MTEMPLTDLIEGAMPDPEPPTSAVPGAAQAHTEAERFAARESHGHSELPSIKVAALRFHANGREGWLHGLRFDREDQGWTDGFHQVEDRSPCRKATLLLDRLPKRGHGPMAARPSGTPAARHRFVATLGNAGVENRMARVEGLVEGLRPALAKSGPEI